MKRINKILPKVIVIICLLIFIFTSFINLIMIGKSSKNIDQEINYNDYKYIIVLGAKVSDNTPSLMLKDRLDKAVDLYNQNKKIKIIVSGDSQNKEEYDEVTVMYNYLINNNVESSNIIKDNYGISTYDSIVRAKDIVKDDKTIIITQKYHLYRSIYIARSLNINASGISAKEYKYFGQLSREIREILARVKDYIFVKLNINSKY